MTLPTVTELPLTLEPVTPDTFIEDASALTSAQRPTADGHASTPDARRRAPQH
jgi:hypothetical protein